MNILYIQAGVAAQQLTAFAHGGREQHGYVVNEPSVGTLTAGGLYHRPGHVLNNPITTVTATSTDNAGVSAQMTIAIYPRNHSLDPATTVDYTTRKAQVATRLCR